LDSRLGLFSDVVLQFTSYTFVGYRLLFKGANAWEYHIVIVQFGL